MSGPTETAGAATPPAPAISYLGVPDATISGSRPGLAALMASYAIERHGHDVHRHRTERARDLAEYTNQQLTGIGWSIWCYPDAFTATPPPRGGSVGAACRRRLGQVDLYAHKLIMICDLRPPKGDD